MPSLPPRAVLETWKRAEIQKLCKDHGLKANLKTEALIDLLLDVNAPLPRVPPPSRTSSRSSSRTRARTVSVVIHEIDPEPEHSPAVHEQGGVEKTEEGSIGVPEPTPLPKPRKAKDLQSKLGKGRPVAAGGSGARAVTKSTSRSKRASRYTRQTEASIPEEPEPTEMAEVQKTQNVPSGRDISHRDGTSPGATFGEQPEVTPSDSHQPHDRIGFVSPEELDMRIKEAVRPLHEQLKQMMIQLDQMQVLKAEAEQLQARVNNVEPLRQQIQRLTLEMGDLRTQANAAAGLNAEMDQLRDIVSSLGLHHALPLTPQITSIPPNTLPQHTSNSSPSTSRPALNRHGSSLVALGKRRHSSTDNNPGDISQMDDDSGSVHGIPAPSKKRQRLSSEGASPKTPANISSQGHGDEMEEEMPRIPTPRAVARFRVYADPEAGSGIEMDHRLPTMDMPASPTQPRRTSAENERPFNFTFMPPPTPHFPTAAQSFPTPNPPASPTPANNHPSSGLLTTAAPRVRTGSRSAVTGPFAPSHTRQRSRRAQSETAGLYVNPAALTRVPSTGEVRPVSGSEAAASLGLRRLDVHSNESQGIHPIRGTIFGTELDSDRRFGDFGVEGVASGFWAGGL